MRTTPWDTGGGLTCMVETYRVRARNTAPDSENRIHDDQTAAAYGFRGGLVPGVTVYGYLSVPVIQHYGTDWLARGGMRVRFLQPVYEGDEVIVTLIDRDVSASRDDGAVYAAGEVFWPDAAPPSPALYPEEPLPSVRPPASAESLAAGRTLGTLHAELSVSDLGYPAALLTLSNYILMQNVQLGPWIHTASELTHYSLAHEGDRLLVRGRIEDRFARKGHQFVVLDLLILADGTRVVQHVRHTAIYELRPRATA